MSDTQKLRQLKATELKLLQDRTKLLRRQEESLRTSAWSHTALTELEEERTRLEAELAAVRAELWRLERESPGAE
jgi:hypothetical protein